jgi:DedD protein
MGIFSFGKKDDAPSRRGANTSSNRAARGERVERRTRRTERAVDADAMLLDPTLPEKQRARRRLVGAIALVVAAVIILPMVLDSHPKPVTDDISIDIPNRPAPKLARSTANEDVQAGVAPDNPPAADTGVAASSLAPATAAAAASTAKQGTTLSSATGSAITAAPKSPAKPQNQSQTQSLATNTAPAASTKQPKVPAAAPSQSSEDDTSTAATGADANSGTPASPPGNRFAVNLGSFSSEASARTWAAKLKAAGVPTYTEHKKQADGSTLTLLRAGPFADRAAATAAVAKVREAGLVSGSNGGSAQ